MKKSKPENPYGQGGNRILANGMQKNKTRISFACVYPKCKQQQHHTVGVATPAASTPVMPNSNIHPSTHSVLKVITRFRQAVCAPATCSPEMETCTLSSPRVFSPECAAGQASSCPRPLYLPIGHDTDVREFTPKPTSMVCHLDLTITWRIVNNDG